MECRNSKDYISELPDCLVHHILSFLDMKSVVPTCILSKRWMLLVKSLPFMKFNQGGTRSKIEDFIGFVDKVLHLHIGPGISGLQTFTLSGVNNGSCITPLKLPIFLYTSRTLTTLKLDMGEKGGPIFELPDSAYLPALKTLDLRNLIIGNLGSFISSCPALATLYIQACRLGENSDFSISAPNLKKLELCSLSSADGYVNPCITVCAPNLEVFTWYGLNYSSTLYVPSLVHGVIGTLNYCDYGRPAENPQKKRETRNARNCLLSFANARELMMSDLLVELAMEPGSQLGNTITSFSNLTILRMQIFHSVSSISTLSSLLAKCPNLEELLLAFCTHLGRQCFDETKEEFGDGEESISEAKLQPQCMLNHLTVVHIKGSLWNIYELELVKFLLKNTTVLERMFVSTSMKYRCYEYKKKIEVFPRASSNVKITFC